jgi:hypothetical protein
MLTIKDTAKLSACQGRCKLSFTIRVTGEYANLWNSKVLPVVHSQHTYPLYGANKLPFIPYVH